MKFYSRRGERADQFVIVLEVESSDGIARYPEGATFWAEYNRGVFIEYDWRVAMWLLYTAIPYDVFARSRALGYWVALWVLP